MSIESLHLVRLSVRAAAAAAVLATLTGCQAIVSGPSLAQVRVVTASPDVPSLDIYQGNTALTYNLGFGSITSYMPFSPGSYTILANTAGTKQTLTSSKATLNSSAQYTVLIGNVAANLQQVTLLDQSLPAPSGQVALRFISQATRCGAVDIYLVPAGQKLTALTPVATGLVFGSNTGYLTVPAGTYTIDIVAAGTIAVSGTPAIYTGAQVTYSEGAARTIILIDQQPPSTAGLQVITADDVDSPQNTN